MQQFFSLAAVSAVLTGLVAFTAQAQPGGGGGGDGPCRQIRAACEQAGFAQGGAKEGSGLLVDCVRPIVQGTPPRSNAKPLPQVDPQLVEACKQRNPNFGQPKQKQ
jgi:hypothetical protein